MRGELPKLRKLCAKSGKKMTDEQKALREDEVNDFEYQVECVPDGVTRNVPPPPPRTNPGNLASGAGGNGRTGKKKRKGIALSIGCTKCQSQEPPEVGSCIVCTAVP